MIRYYQLTPDILLEYVYADDPKLNNDNKKDIHDNFPTILLKSEAFSTKYLCFKNESEGFDSLSNLVLPLNNTETQFVVAKKKNNENKFFSKTNSLNRFLSKSKTGTGYLYENTNYDENIKDSCDVKFDKCIIHFTSRNYFGDFDSLIFQAYVYMKNKTKFYLSSFLFKKTSNLEMSTEQFLYNEKLYTTQIEFDIPSVRFILDDIIKNPDDGSDGGSDDGSDEDDRQDFVKALKSQDIELLENTPIGINIYGVSGSTIGTDNYERLKTFKINSISIPYISNKFDAISVKISESEDGDYYIIDPKISNYTSIVDYIKRLGENIRIYIIMHELCLIESWVDTDGDTHSEITHKEIHIVDINENDEDADISEKFDAKIKYRPICINSGSECTATIIDTIKIINSVDNSSYEIKGSKNIDKPHKYGKKLNTLGFKNDSRPMVNVYNKNVTSSKNSDKVIVVNKGGGFIVENMTQNITSFIECTNIGVSIVELSTDSIN
jgi:hypothetical protein